MSMAVAMEQVARLAKRGIPADKIIIAGLSTKTISNIVKLNAPVRGETKMVEPPLETIGDDCFMDPPPELMMDHRPTARWIMEKVASKYGFTVDDLRSRRRPRILVKVRHEACYRMACDTPLSLTQIGRAMGQDHTTIIYAICSHAAATGLPLPRGMQVGMTTNKRLALRAKHLREAECQ